MKSFPSTANEAKNMYGSTESQSLASTFDISRIKALNLNSSVPVLQEMLKEQNINAGNYQMHIPMHTINVNYMTGDDKNQKDTVIYEDPFHLPSDVIALAKDYEWVYKYQIKSLLSMGEKSGDSIKTQMANTSAVPSMFNPMYGVNALGMIRNTPLLNDMEDFGLSPDIDDCSIRTLCAMSKNANSELGMARYKYADFMYCKDLGKVANNHLITLRKFAHPVADHIFEMASPKFLEDGGSYSWKNGGDVGRLITWFGTDDNKLEDICKYSYNATWKELTSQIEEKNSKADDANTGILGMISNSFTPVYNTSVNKGQAGSHSIWGWLGSQLTPAVYQGIGSNNDLLRNYDNNKVYTPKNTIQQNHVYEGKLVFSHEFTLNFSYKLRAYDNINPRSAFTDLIGNVLEVTYRRGKFWGGDRKLIGPAQDVSTFDKAYAMVDKTFDQIGGFFSSIMKNGIDFKSIMGKIGSGATNMINAIVNTTKNIANGNGAEMVSNLANGVANTLSATGAAEATKGYVKNALGRPQLYAWQSLLSGDDVGLWHVTIGNPRNPILSIGNLIMTNATITHGGPLGIDDFPSELRVSVTLKHARPRDVTDIGRMYTKGASAIYQVMAGHSISDFWSEDGGENAAKLDEDGTETYTMKEKQAMSQKDRDTQITNDAKNYNALTANSTSYTTGQSLTRRDPSLRTSEEIGIMRKNTYSDAIFRMMLDETA